LLIELVFAQVERHALALPRLWFIAEGVEQELGRGLVELQLLSGLDEVEEVDGLAEDLHLLIEVRDDERSLVAALEVGDFEETLLAATDAFGKCAHGCLPG